MDEVCLGGLVVIAVVLVWAAVKVLTSINWRAFWGGLCLLVLIIAFLAGGPSGEEILVVAGWFVGDRVLKAIRPKKPEE